MSADQKTLDVYNKHISDYEKLIAKEFKDKHTYKVKTWEDFVKKIKTGGFVVCGWDGSEESEQKIKKKQRLPFAVSLSTKTQKA